jgi:hypothetical protein
VLSFGPDARPLGDRWEAGATSPVWRLHAPEASAEVLAALGAHVAAATVGWRLLVAGPEADVLAACAVATDGGALAAEISAVMTDRRRRRVRCVHCAATTETEAPAVTCPGCGRALRVEPSLSRRHAAYLGLAAPRSDADRAHSGPKGAVFRPKSAQVADSGSV